MMYLITLAKTQAMRSSIIFVLFLSTFFVSCDVLQEMIEATAQQQQPDQSQESGPRTTGEIGDVKTRSSKDRSTTDNAELAKELGLNAQQANNLTAITDQYNKDLVSIRENTKGDSSRMNAEMRKRRTKYNIDLKGLLNATQQRKYEAYLKKKADSGSDKMQRTN